jgi:Cys-rich repeat protein
MNPDACRQCPRNFAGSQNQPPNICDAGYYCNEAAVCAPCVGNQFCGKTCRPCMGATPYCVPSPTDPEDATCVQCRDTPDCPIGQFCISNVCTTPNLCCPETPHQVTPDPSRPTIKVCSQCAVDADCGAGRHCDKLNARCVDQIPDCNSDNKCGKDCVDCKAVSGNRPYCLNGQVCVQCRTDFDCGSGQYCLSGDCTPCLADRHCGPGCQSCGRTLSLGMDGASAVAKPSDKPFCYSPDSTVGSASCVRCVKDSDCGAGGQCDQGTHECTNKCSVTCPEGKLCDGSRCVDCYNAAQCPCGACDLSTGTCSAICNDNSDCMGNQCCTRDDNGDRKCRPGRCAGTAGGALCGCSIGTVGAGIADNNTLDENGVELSRSRGGALAALALLLCGVALRRRFAPSARSAR